MIEDGELLGDLLKVPDKWWGFEAFGRENHPGACVGYDGSGYQVTMLKGTDTQAARYASVHVFVKPDDSNRLLKTTAFAIKPFCKSARKVRLLREDRFIGKLADSDLANMQSELLRLFGEEE